MGLVVERLDARERSAYFWAALGEGAFPPWLIHANPASDIWWGRVRLWWPEDQVVLIDEDVPAQPATASTEPLAACWGVPIAWDGTIEDLPSGYTATLQRAVEGHEAGVRPSALVVCAAVVLPVNARRGVAGTLLAAMRDLPAAQHLAHVLVPVRPTLKAAYPLTPIEVYAAWRRADGLPLDPWLRTHARIGGKVLSCAPASQTLTAPVAQWETWSGLALPSTGRYVIPGGLAPLEVDRENDGATMVEPNIWVQHR